MRLSGTKRTLLGGLSTSNLISTFTSTTVGAFTVNAPTGAITAKITIYGGGGRGGGTTTNFTGCGAGGGQGGIASSTVQVVAGNAYAYTLGAVATNSFWGPVISPIFGATSGGVGGNYSASTVGGAGGTPFGAYTLGTTGQQGFQGGPGPSGTNGIGGGPAGGLPGPPSGTGGTGGTPGSGGGGGTGGVGVGIGGPGGLPKIIVQWYSH